MLEHQIMLWYSTLGHSYSSKERKIGYELNSTKFFNDLDRLLNEIPDVVNNWLHHLKCLVSH